MMAANPEDPKREGGFKKIPGRRAGGLAKPYFERVRFRVSYDWPTQETE
jgi:hypothetical protein